MSVDYTCAHANFPEIMFSHATAVTAIAAVLHGGVSSFSDLLMGRGHK